MTEFSPLEFLCQRDSVLAKVIESIGDYSIETHEDPFESLLKSIYISSYLERQQMRFIKDCLTIMAEEYRHQIGSLQPVKRFLELI